MRRALHFPNVRGYGLLPVAGLCNLWLCSTWKQIISCVFHVLRLTAMWPTMHINKNKPRLLSMTCRNACMRSNPIENRKIPSNMRFWFVVWHVGVNRDSKLNSCQTTKYSVKKKSTLLLYLPEDFYICPSSPEIFFTALPDRRARLVTWLFHTSVNQYNLVTFLSLAWD